MILLLHLEGGNHNNLPPGVDEVVGVGEGVVVVGVEELDFMVEVGLEVAEDLLEVVFVVVALEAEEDSKHVIFLQVLMPSMFEPVVDK